MTPKEQYHLQYNWNFWGRPNQLTPDGEWVYWLILAGRGWGKTRTGAEWVRRKIRGYPLVNLIGATLDDARDVMIEGEALAIDTPLPTPDGWKTMGCLKVGDRVFDERGKITKIDWVSPVVNHRKCYRVKFSDGTSIIADEDHKWFTHTRSARQYMKAGAIYTTKQIADTLTKDGWNNHAIKLPCAVNYPRKKLPIDPYVLGAWLGDGRSRSGDFTSGTDEIPDMIRSKGYEVRKHAQKYGYRICGIDPELKKLGVVGNKHIPLMYLMASTEQRLDLLRGLMDTDGYVSARGQCAFDGNNRRLVECVRELVRSLGMTCAEQTKEKYHASFPHAAPMLRLTFTPTMDVVYLKKKKDRLVKLSKKASWRNETVRVGFCPAH